MHVTWSAGNNLTLRTGTPPISLDDQCLSEKLLVSCFYFNSADVEIATLIYKPFYLLKDLTLIVSVLLLLVGLE